MINTSGPSSHIVKILVDSFGKNGKNTRSKDRNATRHVLSQAIVNKNTKVLRFLKPTSKLVNLNVKTLHKYSIRREHLDTTVKIDFWAFIGRLPCRDMKLVDAVNFFLKYLLKVLQFSFFYFIPFTLFKSRHQISIFSERL